MSTVLRRGWLAGLALRELGFRQLAWYGLYRLGVSSGHYRRVLPAPPPDDPSGPAYRLRPVLNLPRPEDLAALLGEAGRAALLAEADEAAAGQVHLFGGAPQQLALAAPGPRLHWTAFEHGDAAGAPHGDIKFLWEPARFGWAITLGRAYHLSRDERYPAAFWQQAEAFLQANPPYDGLHWASAQEAALRLMVLVFAAQVFAASPQTSAARAIQLAQAIAHHAARIPPTLPYARAQNNNHLLSEAAGLYTAGLALPDHPQAPTWRALGWKVFQHGLLAQIAPDGCYSQHSTNYHRLMLQLVLWVGALSRVEGRSWPPESHNRLAAATGWLLALLDPATGRVPNLGPNDGAYIFPFTSLPFGDYRPVLQAAGLQLYGDPPLASGLWDEMGLWFGLKTLPMPVGGRPVLKQAAAAPRFASAAAAARPALPAAAGSSLPGPHLRPHTLHSADGRSWAYLRVAHFTGRPGHADQLHLDLWWQGVNVAQDPGTYLYNAAPPWDNALRMAEVHNTVTVFGQDQMYSAGRFLYLQRAQARLDAYREYAPQTGAALTASHTGYARLGVIHTRTVEVTPAGQWCIDDRLTANDSAHPLRTDVPAALHWLLPDWPWQVQPDQTGSAYTLRLAAPEGEVRLALSARTAAPVISHHRSLKGGEAKMSVNGADLQIARAGQRVYGAGEVRPSWGWSSPTYGDKRPALSICMTISGQLPILFKTCWTFPESE